VEIALALCSTESGLQFLTQSKPIFKLSEE